MTTKRKRDQRPPEVHFISSLPPEAVRDVLLAQTDGSVSVEVERVDADTLHYRMQYLFEGRILSEARGSLSRWAGSMTRVTCDSRLVNPGIWHHLSKMLLNGFFLLSAMLAMWVGFALAIKESFLVSLLLPIIIIYVIMEIFQTLERRLIRREPLPSDREFLLDRVVDALADSDGASQDAFREDYHRLMSVSQDDDSGMLSRRDVSTAGRMSHVRES